MFLVGDVRLQGIDISGDFRPYRIPISSGSIFGGLDVVIHLFGCCRRRSNCAATKKTAPARMAAPGLDDRFHESCQLS